MSNRYLTFVLGVFIALITFLVYLPVLDKDFATRDDRWMVYANPDVLKLSNSTINHAFTTIYNGQYSPFNTLYYAIIYFYAGPNPFWFNLFSLLIHIGNGLIVYKILMELLMIGTSVAYDEKRTESIEVAFFSTLVFAVHPVQVESVAWISASKIVLSSLFILIGLYSYLKYHSTRRPIYYSCTVVCFLLALGCKEQSVVFPVLILLIDIFILKTRILSRRYILLATPLFLIALCYGFFSIKVQDIGFQDLLTKEYYPFWQRIVLSFYTIMDYLFKIFAPINLEQFYKFPMAPGQILPGKYIFYPIVFFSLVFLILKVFIKNKNLFAFGLLFFLANIALALHIFPMGRRAIMADRYLYLAIIGIAFPIFKSLLITKSVPKFLTILYCCITLYFIYLTTYTLIHTHNWV